MITKGLFHAYLKPESGRPEFYEGSEYEEESLIPRIKDVKDIESAIGSVPTLNLSGLTTDQQLYRPEDTIHVLMASLGNGNATVALEMTRNGVPWLEDEITLNYHGLAIYKLHGADLGTYEVSGVVKKAEDSFSLGSISFEVAAFQLDPFTVKVTRQSISERQLLTAEIVASILGNPHSGPLKVGLYCSFCKKVVMSDEITCDNGKGLVSFDVSGHTAPFSLEFVIPDQGYTARVQLEGTRPEERQKIPISHNLRENHAMLLFPQAGSIDVQGINVVRGDKNPNSPFRVSSIIGHEVPIEMMTELKMVGIIVYHPVSMTFDYQLARHLRKGDTLTINVKDPHAVVLLSGVKPEGELFEAFFIALSPVEDFPVMEVPNEAEAGKNIVITITNPRESEIACLLLVHDQRKTHKSLYKVLGKQVHSFLSRFAELQRKFLELETLARAPPMPSPVRKMRSRRSVPRSELMTFAAAAPPLGEDLMTLSADFILAEETTADIAPSVMSTDLTSDLADFQPNQVESIELLEHYPEVLFCDIIYLKSHEKRKLVVKLGDQVTTWICRLNAFYDLSFAESVKHVVATKTRYVDVRAPAIIDAESGDHAEIEVKCVSDVVGTLSVYFNDTRLLVEQVNRGSSSLVVPIDSSGMVRAVLETEKGIIETQKEILEPFAQTLVYWHLIHLFPGDTFIPPQPVTVHPSPLFLLKESALSLLQYPYGCAEQTSSKTGALAIVYKYQRALGDADRHETLELMKVGLARLCNVFYDSERQLFGLWSKEDANPPVTQQVLRNLAPLREIWDDTIIPESFKEMIESATRSLLKEGITSFDLLPHSPEFRPNGELSDVKDVALALIHDLNASDEQKRSWLEFIRKTVETSKEECWWFSPKAWGGKLETTAIVLRALVKNINFLDEDLTSLYKQGMEFVNKFLINGRLFTTSDTFALINLFADSPSANPSLELADGRQVKVIEKMVTEEPFVVKTHAFVSWTEERLANPFESLPKGTLSVDIVLDNEKLRVGDRTKLTVKVSEEAFCPVMAICLPPHLALLRGGGNIQQHYIAFEGDDTLTLDIVAVRQGQGHVRVVVHEMYDPEKSFVAEPIVVSAR